VEFENASITGFVVRRKTQAGKSHCYCDLYNNQINAHALIGQSAMVHCAINPWEKRVASKL